MMQLLIKYPSLFGTGSVNRDSAFFVLFCLPSYHCSQVCSHGHRFYMGTMAVTDPQIKICGE